MSRSDPAPSPGVPSGPPRWLLVMLAAGISLLIAAVLVIGLGAVGVASINEVGFVLVLIVAALIGGWITRLLAPRLPAIRRPPRA